MAQTFAGHLASASQQGQSSPPVAIMPSQSSMVVAGGDTIVALAVGMETPKTTNIATMKRTVRMF